MNPKWNQMAIGKWLFASDGYCPRCFSTYARPSTSTFLQVLTGRGKEWKIDGQRLKRNLGRVTFCLPFTWRTGYCVQVGNWRPL